MTTLEPGASEVFTHGLVAMPRSTAFLASRAAPIITVGFDVLVHDVIAAITTAPWSSSNELPSSISTMVGRLIRPPPVAAADACCGLFDPSVSLDEGGSEAGKL